MKQKAFAYAIILTTLLLTGWFGWRVKEQLKKPNVDPRSVSSEPSLALRARTFTGASPESPDSLLWQKGEALGVPVNFQVLALPWGRSNKPPLRVRALRDAERIHFLLEWPDSTENRQTDEPQRFADAVAIMFPLKVEQPVTLMMGFLGPAEIWQWKADWDQKFWAAAPPRNVYADFYPLDSDVAFHPAQASGNLRAAMKPPSAVECLTADGPGTVRSKPDQRVYGRGVWRDGRWRVVMSRALAPEKSVGPSPGNAPDYAFAADGARRRIAFAVWDGAQAERGARKSISEWVWLELAEAPGKATQTAAATQSGLPGR